MARKKVLLFVVDGCTPRIMAAGLAAGTLPNLARLCEAGFHDPECSAIFPSITPAATASIVTGRYPFEHGIVGAHFFDRETGEVTYYGDDFDVIFQQGVGKFFQSFLVGMNARQLDSETAFDLVETQDGTSASINYLIFRGPVRHRVHVPALLGILPGVPLTATVPGPSVLHLGDLVTTPLPSGRPPKHRGGILHRYGMDDHGTAEILVQRIREGLPDFTVAYFPGYDHRAHEVGPEEARPALQTFDGLLGEIYDAFGGFDRMLQRHAVLLTADHSLTAVRDDNATAIPVDDVLEGFDVAEAGKPWQDDEGVKVCVNLRVAHVYFRRPSSEAVSRACRQMLAHQRVDQVICPARHVRDGKPGFVVTTRDRGQLHVWPTGHRGAARDDWGRAWSWEGELGALDVSVEDGRLRFGTYPNAFERIHGLLESDRSGQLVATSVPGVEFTLPVTEPHRAGGSHGSLHVDESLVPLVAAGLPEGVRIAPPTRTVDVTPLCLEVLGLTPPRSIGASHVEL